MVHPFTAPARGEVYWVDFGYDGLDPVDGDGPVAAVPRDPGHLPHDQDVGVAGLDHRHGPGCALTVFPLVSYGDGMARNIPQDSWERVGDTVRTMREIRGFKPDELASAVGISRPYLANIEAGRKRLTPVLLARIAATLDVPQRAILEASRDEQVA